MMMIDQTDPIPFVKCHMEDPETFSCFPFRGVSFCSRLEFATSYMFLSKDWYSGDGLDKTDYLLSLYPK